MPFIPWLLFLVVVGWIADPFAASAQNARPLVLPEISDPLQEVTSDSPNGGVTTSKATNRMNKSAPQKAQTRPGSFRRQGTEFRRWIAYPVNITARRRTSDRPRGAESLPLKRRRADGHC